MNKEKKIYESLKNYQRITEEDIKSYLKSSELKATIADKFFDDIDINETENPSPISDEVAVEKLNENVAPLLQIFNVVWEGLNKLTNIPFKVLTNINYYKNSVFDSNFVRAFVEALQHNLVIVPIKIVNITDLNTTLNFNTSNLESYIRLSNAGIRAYCTIYTPSLGGNTSEVYSSGSDYVLLDIDPYASHASFGQLKEAIFTVFKEIDTKSEEVKQIIKNLSNSNPRYHELVYKKNKLETAFKITKDKLTEVSHELAEFEMGVLNLEQRIHKDDDYEEFRVRKFNQLFCSEQDNISLKEKSKPFKLKVNYDYGDEQDNFPGESGSATGVKITSGSFSYTMTTPAYLNENSNTDDAGISS